MKMIIKEIANSCALVSILVLAPNKIHVDPPLFNIIVGTSMRSLASV